MPGTEEETAHFLYIQQLGDLSTQFTSTPILKVYNTNYVVIVTATANSNCIHYFFAVYDEGTIVCPGIDQVYS